MEERISFPVRLLNVVGGAAKENGRYMLNAVLLERCQRPSGPDALTAVASDGTRIIIAEQDVRLPEANHAAELKLLIPGDVARNAAKLPTIKRSEDEEPTAVINSDGNEFELRVFTEGGQATFAWQRLDGEYPPYREKVPNWNMSIGVAQIGIAPDLVASTLRSLQRIVGKEPKTRVYLPSDPARPMGFESLDGNAGIRALGVVMPTTIDGWTKPQAVAGEASPDKDPLPEEPLLPGFEPDKATPAKAPDPEAWREAQLADILANAVGEHVLRALADAKLTTLGQLADYTKNNSLCDITGIGPATAERIEAALTTYWAHHPQPKATEAPAPPSTPAPAPAPEAPAPQPPPATPELTANAKSLLERIDKLLPVVKGEGARDRLLAIRQEVVTSGRATRANVAAVNKIADAEV